MPMASPRKNLHGIDCAWLAADSTGQVAIFTTAGEGPVPEAALSAIETLEANVHLLPEVSAFELLVSIKRPEDFVAFASRGLFAYDWSDIHKTAVNTLNAYELLARPISPITVAELPASLRVLATSSTLSGTVFGAASIPRNHVGI
jgi:hypothetical protein